MEISVACAAMSEENVQNTGHRFADVNREPCRMFQPVEGFNREPLVSLEEATVPLKDIVPRLEVMVYTAKKRATNPANNLTSDESAAIALYTMEWTFYRESLYYILNGTLRTEDRNNLKPWFRYLKLLLTALSRLPAEQRTIYRGVRFDNENEFDKYHRNAEWVWWGFSSCSASREVCEKEQFLGESGRKMLFIIECMKGKDISLHSYFRKESEILLKPGTTVKVISHKYKKDGLEIVRLREIESPHPLLEDVSSEEEIRAFISMPVTDMKFLRKTQSTTSNSERYSNTRLSKYIVGCKERSKICLNGQRYNDDDINIIVQQLILGKQCQELFLGESRINPAGADAIAKALNNNNNVLEGLFLTKNKIGDRGAAALADALAHNKNVTLKELCLGNNGITNEGINKLVVMLKSNTTLTHLWLQENEITDAGLQQLIEVLTNTNHTLQYLSLERNKFHIDQHIDSILRMLSSNDSLILLNLNKSCKLSKAIIKDLRNATTGKPNFKLILE